MKHGKHKTLSVQKAKKILKHGEVRGHPLSEKQKGLFGIVAGGKTPRKWRKTSDGKMKVKA